MSHIMHVSWIFLPLGGSPSTGFLPGIGCSPLMKIEIYIRRLKVKLNRGVSDIGALYLVINKEDINVFQAGKGFVSHNISLNLYHPQDTAEEFGMPRLI